jgi:hypothetical protein
MRRRRRTSPMFFRPNIYRCRDGSAVSRASATRFLPDAGTAACYFSCISAFRSRLGLLGAKELRESATAGPAFPSGLAPAGSSPGPTSTSRFAARALRSDVGCQDLSILPGANQMTTLPAP